MLSFKAKILLIFNSYVLNMNVMILCINKCCLWAGSSS